MNKNIHIVIVGIGYVGLSNAITFGKEYSVKLIDICKEKIQIINSGLSPIESPEFIIALKSVTLTAAYNTSKEYKYADYIFIATSTNYLESNKHFDTTSIESTLKLINNVNRHATIVIRSTVPIGYTKRIAKKFPSLNIIFCPEFLTENHAIYDCAMPSRIIIGLPNKNIRSLKIAHDFLTLLKKCINDNSVKTLISNSNEAEAIKLFSNTYLALRVSFFNEIDNLAQVEQYDVSTIIKGISLDPRIGNFYNNPSFGYGGYCLPKDTKQLASSYKNIPHNLISAIIDSNAVRKEFIAKQIIKKATLYSYKTIGIYRIVMKEKSANYRQSAILDVIKILLKEKNLKIIVYEPILSTIDIHDVLLCNNFKKFIDRSDLIVANRINESLFHCTKPVYSADIFHEN